jgi:hypothetical protein
MATPKWTVIGRVDLQDHHWPSRTRHTIHEQPCPPFTRLEIATYGKEAGFYLLHLCSDDRGTDTWHATLDDAFYQAEFEFGVKPDEWHMQADLWNKG